MKTMLAAVAALTAVLQLHAADEPFLRFGVMTDTHVGKTVKSCEKVRMALELFRERGCSLVINNGDIADWHYPTGYESYRQVSDAVFAGGERPREIFAYAWHDAFAYKGHERKMAAQDAPEAFEETRRLLKASNAHTETVRFRGYTFVVFPQFVGSPGFIGWADYERMVSEACAANPGKPVFVVDHIPAGGAGGNMKSQRTRILAKFPQVVYLCGHSHGSLRNDRFIRQDGGFTAINAGFICPWREEAHGVLTVDVFGDRLLVRRWDIRDRSEIHPERPWLVPLPFVAATAPWRRETLKAAAPVPEFADGDKVAVSAEGTPFAGFRLSYPSIGDAASRYRIDIERRGGDGTWGRITWLARIGDWQLAPRERTPELSTVLNAGLFTSGETVRFTVRPVNEFGVGGSRALVSEPVVVPAVPGEVVLDSSDPVAEFGFVPRSGKAPKMRTDKDGWSGPFGESPWVMHLPKGLFAARGGTLFRIVIDLETRQPEDGPRLMLRLAESEGANLAGERQWTPPGESGNVRYVQELKVTGGKKATRDSYGVYFGGGDGCLLKVNRLKVVKIAK